MQAVIEIGSEADFDKTIKDSGSALVVVDYSTTWCGPCKGTIFTLWSCDDGNGREQLCGSAKMTFVD
jgi:thiol-disulfide isomerase/thioredoxin